MKIESLCNAFKSYRDQMKSESGKHPTKYRYPEKLRKKAIRYYESNPDVRAQELATMLGISSTSRDRWFGDANRKGKPESGFVEVVSSGAAPSANGGPAADPLPDLRIRCIDITVPGGTDPDRILTVIRSLSREAD